MKSCCDFVTLFISYHKTKDIGLSKTHLYLHSATINIMEQDEGFYFQGTVYQPEA